MSEESIILVGAGGHAVSVIETLNRLGINADGILDLPSKIGQSVMGVPVVGTDDDIPRLAAEKKRFLVTVGQIADAGPRLRLHKLIKNAGGVLATVVSPVAIVSTNAVLGEGTIVLNLAAVNAGVSIGRGCIINTGAIVEHGVTIGDYCHIATGAIVNGDVTVGDNFFIGSGAVIANGVRIVSGAVIGAGSVVVSDITKAGIWFGNPAKPKE